jgi:lipoyl(octanoyl) transferase
VLLKKQDLKHLLTKIGLSDAKREENITGVWVNNKKIAALGVKVKRWVTMHGLAINVPKQSIDNFSGIVPCGLSRGLLF